MTGEDVRVGPPGGEAKSSVGSRPIVLTERQLELVRLRALGFTFKAAADWMGVSMTTAKREMRHIHEALGATCDADIYRDLGWLVVP